MLFLNLSLSFGYTDFLRKLLCDVYILYYCENCLYQEGKRLVDK